MLFLALVFLAADDFERVSPCVECGSCSHPEGNERLEPPCLLDPADAPGHPNSFKMPMTFCLAKVPVEALPATCFSQAFSLSLSGVREPIFVS